MLGAAPVRKKKAAKAPKGTKKSETAKNEPEQESEQKKKSKAAKAHKKSAAAKPESIAKATKSSETTEPEPIVLPEQNEPDLDSDVVANASAASTPPSRHGPAEIDAVEEIADPESGLEPVPERPSSGGTQSSSIAKRKKLRKMVVNLVMCRHHVLREVIHDVIAELGWGETEHERDWQLLWVPIPVSENLCMRLRRPQRINHFPGMHQIAHKCELARTIDRIKQLVPEHYKFHPDTFNLPVDRQAFERSIATNSSDGEQPIFIIKPDGGACGHGIFMTRKASSVPHGLTCVAQRYLNDPMLIDGRKFDLRLYVLVTSFNPLRVYLHHAGLARFASEKYEPVTKENIRKSYMHLTNYSLNKKHPDFQVVEQPTDEDDSTHIRGGMAGEQEEAVGSKRSVEWVREWMARQGFDVAQVWGDIEELLVKTLLAAQPQLAHAYKTCISDNHDSAGFSCFEVLGFDVMLDAAGTPWLIEVNENPSWETSSPLDFQVKHAVLKEAFQMICPTVQESKLLDGSNILSLPHVSGAAPPPPGATAHRRANSEAARWREAMVALRVKQERCYARGFRQIYPLDDGDAEVRPGSAQTSFSAASSTKPMEAEAAGWDFLGGEAERLDERLAMYAECQAAAEEVFTNSLWMHLSRQSVELPKPPHDASASPRTSHRTGTLPKIK